MWKITIPDPDGGEPAVHWVICEKPAAAEAALRIEAGDRMTAQTPIRVEHVNAAGVSSSRRSDDRATGSQAVNRDVQDDPDSRPCPQRQPSSPSTTGLRQAADTWTVTIAGTERYDGVGPYIWVVNAPDTDTAAAVAENHHRTSEQDTDTVVRSVEPGAPTIGYPWVYNDLRGIASQTVLLTPHQIRLIARIRLACKRRSRHLATVESAGHVTTAYAVDAIEVMNDHIVGLVGQLIDQIGAQS